MANLNVENDSIGGGGLGGLGGYGGGYGIIILLFLFFAIFCGGGLFGRNDGHNVHVNGEYGGAPQPWFIDRDIIEQGCKDRAETALDGEKTRSLIVHESERNEDRYVRGLESKIQSLEIEKNFDSKLVGLYGAVEKGFCRTDSEIAKLSCELPKRPPVFSRCDVPCLTRVPDNGCDRGRHDDFC